MSIHRNLSPLLAVLLVSLIVVHCQQAGIQPEHSEIQQQTQETGEPKQETVGEAQHRGTRDGEALYGGTSDQSLPVDNSKEQKESVVEGKFENMDSKDSGHRGVDEVEPSMREVPKERYEKTEEFVDVLPMEVTPDELAHVMKDELNGEVTRTVEARVSPIEEVLPETVEPITKHAKPEELNPNQGGVEKAEDGETSGSIDQKDETLIVSSGNYDSTVKEVASNAASQDALGKADTKVEGENVGQDQVQFDSSVVDEGDALKEGWTDHVDANVMEQNEPKHSASAHPSSEDVSSREPGEEASQLSGSNEPETVQEQVSVKDEDEQQSLVSTEPPPEETTAPPEGFSEETSQASRSTNSPREEVSSSTETRQDASHPTNPPAEEDGVPPKKPGEMTSQPSASTDQTAEVDFYPPHEASQKTPQPSESSNSPAEEVVSHWEEPRQPGSTSSPEEPVARPHDKSQPSEASSSPAEEVVSPPMESSEDTSQPMKTTDPNFEEPVSSRKDPSEEKVSDAVDKSEGLTPEGSTTESGNEESASIQVEDAMRRPETVKGRVDEQTDQVPTSRDSGDANVAGSSTQDSEIDVGDAVVEGSGADFSDIVEQSAEVPVDIDNQFNKMDHTLEQPPLDRETAEMAPAMNNEEMEELGQDFEQGRSLGGVAFVLLC
jgi:hypothetical protein